MSNSNSYRINLKLNLDRDADLIAWIEGFPRGTRSEAIREALRHDIQGKRHSAHVSVEDIIRSTVMEALSHLDFSSSVGARQRPAISQLEDEFGSKLDDMLTGLG